MRVAIVGAGFGAVATAVRLKRLGVEDLVLLERGDRVGGVWRANTYPGAACDIPSHSYSLTFAPHVWSRRYAPGPEIQRYLEDVVREHDLERHLRLGADVERASWDDDAGTWTLRLAGGEEVTCDVLVSACGQLTRPKVPDLPGLGDFAGPIVHTAHWDQAPALAGRRVVVIGTGASAIQLVPAIADETAHVTVLQRSAPWVIPKLDAAYKAPTRALYRRVPVLSRAARAANDAVFEATVPLFTRRPSGVAKVLDRVTAGLCTANRAVQLRFDRELLAQTRPDSPPGCKRTLFTRDWYPTMRRPDVTLTTAAPTQVEPGGVRTADGVLHEADVLVLGTGFTTTDFLAPMEVEGREGTLAEAWAQGAEAHLGITVPGFPNLFLLYGPNTNHGTGSALRALEAQAVFVTDAVRLLRAGLARRLEVRREAHEAFQHELDERLADTVWTSCANWYVNAQGRVTNNWPGSHTEYERRTRTLGLSDFHLAAPRTSGSAVPA